MTLKQFAQLAGGVLVALIFYGLPIPSFIKWPLVTGSAFAGFALAFVPIEERPLNVWIAAFFKSIFAPTVFNWRKTENVPDLFSPITLSPVTTQASSGPTDKAQLNAYLQNLSPKTTADQSQEAYLKQIAHLFEITPATGQTPQPMAPLIEPKPILIPIGKPQATPPEIKPIMPKIEPKAKPAILPKVPAKPFFVPPLRSVIPPTPPKVEPTTFDSHLVYPDPPERPNVLAGMVVSRFSELLEGAIIEIRNSQGMAVRALKTNKLGQFAIATPLENDTYEIETEKDGQVFDIIKLEAKGELLKPIMIRAKGENGLI